MTKRFLSTLLAVLMVISLIPVAALAEEPTGTQSDPYPITQNSASESGLWLRTPGYYRLDADIMVPCMGAATNAAQGENKKFTIDLNGHSITQTADSEYATVYMDSDLPELELTGSGSIVAGGIYSTFEISGNGNKLTVGGNVTLTRTAERANDASFAIFVTGKVGNQTGATGNVEINFNGKIKDQNGITVNGNCQATPKIKLDGANIDVDDVGIYQAGPSDVSDVNLTGSTITAKNTAIEVRAGKLSLEESTVTGGSGESTVNPDSSGSTTTNAAVAVSQHTTTKDIAVELGKNVKLSGGAALSIANPQNNSAGTVTVNVSGGEYNGAVKVAEDATNATLSITGGTFSSDPSAYTAAGFQATENADHTYTVAKRTIGTQTATIRGKGPAGDVAEYNYPEQYAKYGISYKDGVITVDESKLLALNLAGNSADLTALSKQIGENMYIFVGLAYTAPTGATKVATAESEDGTPGDKIALGTNSDSVYNNQYIQYYAVAKVNTSDDNKYVEAMSDNSFDPEYVVWYKTAGDADTVDSVNKLEISRKVNKVTVPNATLQYTDVADMSIVSDCIDETMWLTFDQPLPAGLNLWFDITDTENNITYGIGSTVKNATTTKLAWSFQNKDQFEKWPTLATGAQVPLGVTEGAKYTLNAYVIPIAPSESTSTQGLRPIFTKEVTIPSVKVEKPGDSIPKNSLPANISEANATAAMGAAASVAVDTTSSSGAGGTAIVSAANDKVAEIAVAADEVTDKATEALSGVDISVGVGETATIMYIPALEVTAKDYKTTGTGDAEVKELTVDITAVLNSVATTVSDADDVKIKTNKTDTTAGTNAAIIDTKPLTVDKPVTLTIELPSGFVKTGATEIYVKHTKNGVHYHKAAVDGNKATLTSSDGLSPFVFMSNATMGASIGGEYFETLAAAIAAVKDGETINLLANVDPDTKITVSGSSKTFTINAKPDSTPYAILAGNFTNATLEGSNNIYTVTYTYTPTHNPPSGGGTTTPTYEVKTPATVTGGTVTVSPARAAQGSTVTVTAAPSEGYEVDTVTVTDANGNAIATTPAGEGRYTFTMPAGAVSVSASFKETGTPKPPVWQNPYSDVKEDDWYFDAVKYVTENGLMQGTGKDKFEPSTKLTRAMFAQILYNKAGKPAVTGTVNYKDFKAGQWYSDAVVWATQNKVLEGYSDGRVGVNDRITREQLALMLWRYVGKPEAPANVTIKGTVSSWAAEAMRWAVANGVINGDQNGNHDPRGTADRAQVAQILMNYYNK